MSQIKLLHSGGNGVSIVAPDSNPASDRTLKLPSDGDGTILTTNSSVGKILQVVQTVKTDTFSSTATSMTDVTGLSVNITPSSTNSKILVFSSIDAYVQKTSSYNASSFFIVVRDTTPLSGVHMRTRVDNSMTCNYINAGGNAVLIYLDSPSTTSQITYKIQFTNWGGSHTTTVNGQANNTYYAKSTIVAQEVAA